VTVSQYFAFVGHYTRACFFLAVAGLVVQGEYWFRNGSLDFSGVDGALSAPFFSFILTVWLSWFDNDWKRREAELRFVWGTGDVTSQAKPLHKFVNNTSNPLKFNPLTSRMERVYPGWRILKILVSSLVSMVCLGVVFITAIFCIFLKSFQEKPLIGPITHSIGGTLINVVAILIFEVIYASVARTLTTWEDWRTYPEYENSCIRKLFTFQFMNKVRKTPSWPRSWANYSLS
jgi:hypothetical protein